MKRLLKSCQKLCSAFPLDKEPGKRLLFLIVVSSLAESAQSAEKIVVHSQDAEEKTDEEVAEEYEINSIFNELSLLVTKLNETFLPRMLQLIVLSIPYTSQSNKSRVVAFRRFHV